MSFASGRFADRGRDRRGSAGMTGAPGPACREAAGAARRLFSREAAEARGQPRLKEIEMIVSAVIARSARALGATEQDRSLVILVVPLCPLECRGGSLARVPFWLLGHHQE